MASISTAVRAAIRVCSLPEHPNSPCASSPVYTSTAPWCARLHPGVRPEHSHSHLHAPPLGQSMGAPTLHVPPLGKDGARQALVGKSIKWEVADFERVGYVGRMNSTVRRRSLLVSPAFQVQRLQSQLTGPGIVHSCMPQAPMITSNDAPHPLLRG